jgi:hypothetical protein
MSAESSGFIVQWQDYRDHRIGNPKPPILEEQYPTETDAIARKRQLQASGMVACIVSAEQSLSKRRRRKAKSSE